MAPAVLGPVPQCIPFTQASHRPYKQTQEARGPSLPCPNVHPWLGSRCPHASCSPVRGKLWHPHWEVTAAVTRGTMGTLGHLPPEPPASAIRFCVHQAGLALAGLGHGMSCRGSGSGCSVSPFFGRADISLPTFPQALGATADCDCFKSAGRAAEGSCAVSQYSNRKCWAGEGFCAFVNPTAWKMPPVSSTRTERPKCSRPLIPDSPTPG